MKLFALISLMFVSATTALVQPQQRREFFHRVTFVTSSLVTQPALAASQDDKDKANLLKGYQRLQYLLDNWEKETTVCKVGQENFGNACERTPLKVMEYLGFKSTTDPLFRADKTIMRLASLVPEEKELDYMEAMEAFAENAENASGTAFISSWGEANPGGGKDRVVLFIERAKMNVITSRDSLATILKILDVKV